MYIVVGLGNPGEEYKNNRHNTGRMVLEYFAQKQGFLAFEKDNKHKALVSEGKIGKEKIVLVIPETCMNKSGLSVKSLVTSRKKAEKLVVLYDDLDIPLGSFKISFGRGSGGHKGIESIARSVQTKNFVRVRIGITPTTPRGKLKKPKGDKKVLDFILGDFTTKEEEIFKKVSKKVNDALLVIVTEGKARAMNIYN